MELKNGYKETEVGTIPNDWEVHNIAVNSTMKARIGWQGLTTAEYLSMGDYYLVTGTDFFDGRIKWETCHFVTKDRFDQDRNIQVKQNDILITKDGTIGKVAFIDELPLDATLNSGVFVVRPIDNAYDPKYCYYVFKSQYFDSFLRKLVAGSTINHLYQKDFVSFQFPLPPTKAEQTAIAAALSDMDNLIAGLEQLIVKKKAIKQGAMQELVRPKEGWVVKTLGEVASFYKGKGLPKSDIDESGRFKCIHYGELFTKYDEFIRVVFSKTDQLNNSFYSVSNDVLMPTSDVTPNGLATASCIKEDGVILGGDILIIRADPNLLDGIYLSYYVKRNREQVMGLVTGSTVYHLYGSDMKTFEIAYPRIEEQREITAILSNMDAEIAALEIQLEKYKHVKLGMMHELLTGKTRLVLIDRK